MKTWIARARKLLEASLGPPRSEPNELDWKADLSPDKKRLTEHLSAFANNPGGGTLVFGVADSGKLIGVQNLDVDTIVNRFANLGREAVEPALILDHAVEEFGQVRLLFIRIPEAAVKPVHVRGRNLDESFIRSGGSTRKASRQELATLLLNSRTPRWEELRATGLMADEDLFDHLEVAPIFQMLERAMPTSMEERLDWMLAERFINREPAGGGYITNLGALSAARELSYFPDLSRKAVRVVVYEGVSKARTRQEQEGKKGYAIGFQGLLKYVMSLLPQGETVEDALRRRKTIYPEIALREIMANALIHQDFGVSGAGPLVEIFDDRIEVSNPGGLLPTKSVARIIGTQPESRNETLARAFRRYKICEERGSGLFKAALEVESYGLPPIEFDAGPNHFKVTLHGPRTFAAMSARERIEACYQHAVLKHLSNDVMTNKSLRERLKMPEKQRSMVSVLIQEAIEKRLVKRADPESKSRKFAEYLPYWA